MSVYLIAYDLVNESGSQDYEPLWAELKRLKAHRTQDSLWLVSLSNTPIEVKGHFKKFMDNDDRLWVTKLRKSQYTYTNAKNGTNDWLTSNPPEP